ncbi:MAG: ATP-binding protein [Treponemataceae bacterium]|nr:MAG: ATP-binding protein [Treponemataceae bacterium]
MAHKFVKRVITKISKLSSEQVEQLLDAITQEREIQESILESLSTGLIVCDNEGLIMHCNMAAERLIPLSRFLVDAKNGDIPVWLAISDKDAAAFIRSLWGSPKVSGAQKIASRDFTITSGQGTVRQVTISAMPLVRRKKIVGTIIKIDDFTEKFTQEVLLHRMESLAGLTNLAANVAHEIKNPLGAISIHIQLIQKSLAKCRETHTIPDENTAERYLEVVNEEIERLNKIIVDFLLAVRPVHADLSLQNPDGIVRAASDFLMPELDEHGIALDVSLSERGGETRVMLDEKLFRQVILNLVKNAVAAIESGNQAKRIIAISSAVKHNWYVLKISDTGSGMDEKTLSHIFEPYFTTKIDGTGLGLTMAYKIIKEFFGDITVSSKAGEGTTFAIMLPIRQSAQKLLSYEGTVTSMERR